MESLLTIRQEILTLEHEEIDTRFIPKITVRMIIKNCLENGTFDAIPKSLVMRPRMS